MNNSSITNSFKRLSAGTIAALFVAVQLPLFLLTSPNVSAAPKDEPKKQSNPISAQAEVTPVSSIAEMLNITANGPAETPAAQNGDPGRSGETPSIDTAVSVEDENTAEETIVANNGNANNQANSRSDDRPTGPSETPAAQNGDPGNSGNTPSADAAVVVEQDSDDEAVTNNGSNNQTSNNEKIFICHATSSQTNPAVLIYTSDNARGAHFDDNGTPKAGHEDDVLNPAGDTCPVVAVEEENEQEEVVSNNNTNPGGIGGNGGQVLGASIVRAQTKVPAEQSAAINQLSTNQSGPANIFTPQVLGASTSKQLANTGNSALTNLFVGLLLISAAVGMTVSGRRQTV